MPRKSTEETQEELEQQKEQVEEQVDQAGEKAKAAAEKQGLSEEEVNKRVEAARKEEKDKLYPQLEELRSTLKEVQEALRAEQKEKDKVKKEAEEEAERKRLEALSEGDRQSEALVRIEEQLKEEREERLRKEKQYAAEKKEATLREYRRNAIQAALDSGKKLLPELVQGNTEEEIDAAVQVAVARYEELAEQVKAELGESTKKKMPRPTSPSMEALEEEELSETLNQVDPEKYRTDPAYREKVQLEISGAYARSTGMQ